MPRSGGGIYNKPFPDVSSGTTIASAVHNGIMADVETDLNAARPIISGGTGAVNALGARANLQVERSMQTVTNFDSHVWEMGSFYAATGATAGPPSGGTTTDHFFGVAYGDATNMFVEARALATGLKYIRKKTGTWGTWALDGGDKLSNTGGTISGNLTITGTLGVTGTTTLGTLNAGTTTTGALTSGAHTVNGALNAGANTLTIGAINASGTITSGPINAGAISGSTLTTSGNATVNGSFATNGISCSTLTTNGNTLTAGNINSSGTVTAPVINATQNDGLKIQVPGGNNARGYYHVAGVRIWTAGVASDGHFKIIDETGSRLVLQLQTDGSATFNGNAVYAGSFNGPLNGNASSANYASSAGSAPANGGTSSASRALVTASDGRTWSVYGTGQVLAIDDSSSGLRGAHFTPYNDPNPSAIDLYMPYHTITTNGVNGTWTNNYILQFISSARYKADIEAMPASLADKVMAFRPVTFRSRCPIDDPDKLHFGLIAEEVEAIEPLLVQYDYTPDAYENEPDKNGGPIRHRLRKDAKKQVMGLDYNAIVSLMLRKVQEQEERIKVLEAKLTQ